MKGCLFLEHVIVKMEILLLASTVVLWTSMLPVIISLSLGPWFVIPRFAPSNSATDCLTSTIYTSQPMYTPFTAYILTGSAPAIKLVVLVALIIFKTDSLFWIVLSVQSLEHYTTFAVSSTCFIYVTCTLRYCTRPSCGSLCARSCSPTSLTVIGLAISSPALQLHCVVDSYGMALPDTQSHALIWWDINDLVLEKLQRRKC